MNGRSRFRLRISSWQQEHADGEDKALMHSRARPMIE
jgi:hypothetical protein